MGAGAAGNDDQDGVLYTCCRDLWNCLYGEQFGRPYFLMAQAVVTFILVLFCAYEARGVSSADDSYQWEIAGPVFGSCVYVVASVILFGHKQQLKTTYENARTKLANYLCCFKGLRALLVVGMLRVFVHVSDIWVRGRIFMHSALPSIIFRPYMSLPLRSSSRSKTYFVSRTA